MKRTLGIIFTLMLIMTAFTACGDLFNDANDFETIVVPASPAEPQTGDLVLQEYDYPIYIGARYSTDPIKREHFKIGFHGVSSYPNTTTSLEELKLKMEISRNDGKTWEDVTFDVTKYGPSDGHVHIKVSQTNGKKYKTIRVEVITPAE